MNLSHIKIDMSLKQMKENGNKLWVTIGNSSSNIRAYLIIGVYDYSCKNSMLTVKSKSGVITTLPIVTINTSSIPDVILTVHADNLSVLNLPQTDIQRLLNEPLS